MAKKLLKLNVPCRRRSFSSETPSLYSFLQPCLFSINNNKSHVYDDDNEPQNLPTSAPQSLSLTPNQLTTLQTTLHKSLITTQTDEAWKSFKTLTTHHSFPPKPLTNSLLTHLSSLGDIHNLKRAFASTIFLIQKNPNLLHFDTIHTILLSMKSANTASPAFALVKTMFKNRFFIPFHSWGSLLVDIARNNGNLAAFLPLFEENCRVAFDEKLNFMMPDVSACNAALEACCFHLESVSDAERVVGIMSNLSVKPDEFSFGFLAYLYALKGLQDKIDELKVLMTGFGYSKNYKCFYSNLISGYVKSGNLAFVESTILSSLNDRDGGEVWKFDRDTFCLVIKEYLQKGNIKGLANLIIEAQKLESSNIKVDESIGFGIVNACVSIGLSDKAHSILDEMNALGGSVGLGVYVPILKAYCKENRTAEATLLVVDISSSGLRLDVETYDALIETSMSGQDFQSVFSLFRDMREARVLDLKGSYLTIMTGLMENNRPELMAAFLDEVAEDPRIEVGTHDWNSIIHAFCKAGRLEDARRTFRRMTFLQFEPNDQTYLSLINGYVSAQKYFDVMMLWNEVKRKLSVDGPKRIKFDQNLVDAFLYAMVKGGFFDAVMQVVEKSKEMKIFVDKWRYKQAFMETHKKLKVARLRKKNIRKMEALIAFKNWAGLNA
ncbi:pentatricopeptide repeat-containing protein At1g69290-like [Trifolium pratense]|uniref:pentatricopeptide repeat-containing protein At1g69290-like n=1 Tax=Trifolium pratense TaxID=57577 RepID=UPI001E68FFF0|nr:pentatricopeptide repeat-containing protein At1g69290-like [Trifolium pratense]XP_045812142.1 pentatricopeptide repeat-containing protein At1g69290-like [Trifolium pratense]XP_045812143.1 pentatricopeptide repeat-containing protein At1g69290-like [Trifolium pratense]XP_045812144.1 pentatricopeptide repeat-containing protein At1g69290-like [Trifolium pratense]XP_045812145.1 pentatricopeptide repeat-containing protein At1g69290-like [Trifolium pratense]